MPKIDPITGCEVMTLLEFCDEEGNQKGQTAGEYLSDFYDEIANADQEQADRYMQKENYKEVLEELRRIIAIELKEWKDSWQYGLEKGDEHYMDDWPKPPIPVEIVKMLDSKNRSGFKTHTSSLVGIARCKDGKLRKFTHKYESFSGDFYEPPNDDWELSWEEINKI